MKFVKRQYVDGLNSPSTVATGGYFYHVINGVPYVVDVVENSYPGEPLTREQVESLCPPVDGMGNPIVKSVFLDAILLDLNSRGFPVSF
jgi:hypothetical protein